MVRTRKVSKLIRSHSLSIHLNADELKTIKTKAIKNNMTLSRYLRQVGISSDESHMPVNQELIAEIRKIGVNINQIARYLNTISKTGGKVINNQLSNEINDIKSRLTESLKNLIAKNDC